jgi:hypothetical protein
MGLIKLANYQSRNSTLKRTKQGRLKHANGTGRITTFVLAVKTSVKRVCKLHTLAGGSCIGEFSDLRIQRLNNTAVYRPIADGLAAAHQKRIPNGQLAAC